MAAAAAALGVEADLSTVGSKRQLQNNDENRNPKRQFMSS